MLYQQMQLGVPALWIQTKDFIRVSELVLKFKSRNYYTITNGAFSLYADGKWKPILVKLTDPSTSDTIETTTDNIAVAIDYVENQPNKSSSTFIINSLEDPKKTASEISGLINHLSSIYRSSFMSDDISAMPYQVIILSPHVCPEEYSFLFVSIEDTYPSFEDLVEIVTHMHSSTNGEIVDITKAKEIAKAGLGLNEFSFINYCLLSVLNTGKVNPEYVYKSKMANVKKNGILEIIKPKITFDSIGGLDNIKQVIERNVFFWQNPQEAERYGITPIRRILTVGVPGTGKSAICEATANALNLDLARTGVSQVMNSFVGQSEANMRAVFQQIKVMAPLCVWIDEFGRDLSGGASSSHVDGGTTDRVHGEFLTGLQELPDNVFLMCAANQLDNLRPEMLRAERFDKIFFVGLPAFEERISIIKIYLPEGDFNYEIIARATKYFTGAEIKSLIKHVKFDVVSTFRRPVTTEDIVSRVPTMRNILWNKDKEMIKNLYRLAYDQWDWASTLQLNDIDDILGNRVQNTDSWEVKI
jgi:AAA+ superfamily predicted ATPase